MVVDAVVRHWVTEFIADAEERDKLRKGGRNHADLFYVDDGMVASSDPLLATGCFQHPCLPV